MLTLLGSVPVLAAERKQGILYHGVQGTFGSERDMGRGIVGVVVSVSNKTITLKARNGSTYFVDASNARIVKAGAKIDISGIAVDDTLLIIGKVSGANVTATGIMDWIRETKNFGNEKGKNLKANFGKIKSKK